MKIIVQCVGWSERVTWLQRSHSLPHTSSKCSVVGESPGARLPPLIIPRAPLPLSLSPSLLLFVSPCQPSLLPSLCLASTRHPPVWKTPLSGTKVTWSAPGPWDQMLSQQSTQSKVIESVVSVGRPREHHVTFILEMWSGFTHHVPGTI